MTGGSAAPASIEVLREIAVPGRWCLHAYYTLCPYAPDQTGRLLIACADVVDGRSEVAYVGHDGAVRGLDGTDSATPDSFWHTGLWQSWGAGSADGSPCDRIYWQAASGTAPVAAKLDLSSGEATTADGELEGMCPAGEPGLSGAHSLLYAAGFSDGVYRPEAAEVPFQARDRHGLCRIAFDPPRSELVLSVAEVLEQHPQRDRLQAADREVKARYGPNDGLTLMCYCVRWNPMGDRLLFYFGNHCVNKARPEPRIASVFTADRDGNNLQQAIDLSFDRYGVHWSWHPDSEHLVGYGPVDDPSDRSSGSATTADGLCLARVHRTGQGYRKIATHRSGGHPSICPTDHDLLVTDDSGPGRVAFIDLRSDRVVASRQFTRKFRDAPATRNPGVIDLHPVFAPDGSRVLVNTLRDGLGTPVELATPRLN